MREEENKMLRDKKVVGAESYIEIFDRKFSNFCEKNILNLEFTIYPTYVEIEDFSGLMTEVLTFELNFNQDVRKFIHEIADELKKFYPKMYENTKKVLTNEELKDLLRTHSPDEIDLLESEYVKELVYTVYRVNNTHNEINVIDHRDNDTRKAYKFTSIPVIEFINTLYDDSEVAYKIFKSKARIIGNI